MNYFYIILGILVLCQVFCIFMISRNGKVHNERSRVIDAVSRMAQDQIELGEPWDHLYKDIYHKYSYGEMMWKFWIPVKNFYKDIK